MQTLRANFSAKAGTGHAADTYEINANRGDVGFRVRVVRKPKQQTRLSHARVADQQQFEQVVAANGKCEVKQACLPNGSARIWYKSA
jgi:hypothetical protein